MERVSPRDCIRQGILLGLAAWLGYGFAEYGILVLGTLLDGQSFVYPSWHWWLTGTLLAMYGATGMLIGAVAGAAWNIAAARVPRLRNIDTGAALHSSVLLALVGAYGVNLVAQLPFDKHLDDKRVFVGVLIALALAVVLVASAVSGRWRNRLAFVANAWTVTGLLLLPYWGMKEYTDVEVSGGRMHWAAVTVVAVLAVAWLTHFLSRPLRRFLPASAGFVVMGQLALGAGIFCGSTLLTQKTPELKAHSASTPRALAPNIVLITVDTVRADHLSLYGYRRKTSPELEHLAEQSTFYQNAISTADFTLPSHASLFTGLYPNHHGAYNDQNFPIGRPLSTNSTTLAQILSRNGYITAGVAANHGYLSPVFGLNHGFEVWDSSKQLSFLCFPALFSAHRICADARTHYQSHPADGELPRCSLGERYGISAPGRSKTATGAAVPVSQLHGRSRALGSPGALRQSISG